MDTEDVLVTCEICKDEVDRDDSYTTDANLLVCQDCVATCERCNVLGDIHDDWCWVDDNYRWCQSCADDYSNWCQDCEIQHTGNAYYVEDRHGSYCENCIQNANYCDDCDEYYMDGCLDHSNGRSVHDYSYRPDPIFHSTDKDERLFFGMEIEVEAGVRRSDASEYASKLEEYDLAYLKHDGSLNCGFEIVTHPMTHDFYKNEAQEFWNTLETLRTRDDVRVRSWDTGTCGVHIHISRTGFNGGAHMHRFLNLVYSNMEFYTAVAGRHSDQWAKFDDILKAVWDGSRNEDGYRNHRLVRSFKDKINDGRNTDRYSAVNTQNRNTLEMRIFRGTVNGNTLRAYLDLAHASVEYTRDLRIADVKAGALQDVVFVQYIEQNADLYPDLCARIAKVAPNLLSENPTTNERIEYVLTSSVFA